MLISRGLKIAAVAAAGLLLSLSFAGAAQAQQCGPMDVVFIVDNSGSMGNVISEIQTQVGKIADSVQTASGGDYQFGLVNMPANDVNVLLDLGANNRVAFDAAVQRMTTVGSSGLGIAYDEALDTVLNHLGPRTGSAGQQTGEFKGVWRPSASKIIMVITDTGPQGFDSDLGTHGTHAHAMAALAATMDIHITGIFVPTGGGTDPAIDRPMLQDLATTSGGLFKETAADASDLADVITEIIAACGGAVGAGGSSLRIDPVELALANLETGAVHITNFAPGTASSPTVWSAEFAEEGEFTTTFGPVANPAAGTEEEILSITVGPNTFQGEHLVAVRAAKGSASDFAIVHIIVNCQPPYFLSAGQPQNTSVASGSTAKVRATPGGDGPLRYQWYRGHTGITSSPFVGGTLPELTTDPITVSSEYWVRVSNACGSRDSATAVVTPQ
ncbi:MAG: vWA domain-containing protein [Thermoanaerobaculia bacterium]